MSAQVIEIDGSYLEGGGQIVRIALSLSCILRRPVRVVKIRANRPNPGLSNQHLYGLNLLAQVTAAKVTGNFMKSTEIEFHPGPIRSGAYTVDTRTAASVTLVLQAVLPVLLFGRASSQVVLVGGTNVGMAPQVDFMTEVFRPNLELFGASFDFDLERRGYYPRGGGKCQVTIPPVPCLKPVDVTRFGELSAVCGWCFVAGKLPERLAHEMKRAVDEQLAGSMGTQPHVEAYKESAEMARDNGSGIILKAATSSGCTLGAGVLGERQVDGQALALKAATELREYVQRGTCVDRYVQDQLVVFMALAAGASRVQTCELTNHTRTAIHVAERMTGVKFALEEVADGHVLVACTGIGHHNTLLSDNNK